MKPLRHQVVLGLTVAVLFWNVGSGLRAAETIQKQRTNQAAEKAEQEEIEPLFLWNGKAPEAQGEAEKDRPRLLVYHAPAASATGACVVVCPGGGYGGLAMGHEGHEIASWFQSFGVTAAILDYRHRGKGYGHPAPLLDAQRAIRLVRANAEKWGIDEKRVGVMGFSAGGHLASSVSTHFDAGSPDADDVVDRKSCRPDFAILCYAVLAFGEPYTHKGSQRNLLGDTPTDELVRSLSSEKQVTAQTPPTFLWHTDQDRAVPPENSVVYYLALRQAQVPAELHVYRNGRHGVGLARSIPGTSQWPGACRQWLRRRGVLSK